MKRISILRRLEALEDGTRGPLQAVVVVALTHAAALIEEQIERERLGLRPRDIVPTIIVTGRAS